MTDARTGAAPVRLAGATLDPEPSLGIALVRLQDAEDPAPIAAALGGELPPQRRSTQIGSLACAWLAPNEWLLTGAPDALAPALAAIEHATAGLAALVLDMSDGRAAFLLTGDGAATALAAHCPLDFNDAPFPVGATARTLFGDAGLFVGRLPGAGGRRCFRLIVDQTRAGYLIRMLAGPSTS